MRIRERKAYEEEIDRLKKNVDAEKQIVRDYYEQKIKDLRDKHDAELQMSSKQSSDLTEQIRAQIRGENEEKLKEMEKDLKERFLRERNLEMQNLVEKLSEEGYQIEVKLKAEFKNKERELERVYQDKIQALEY